MAEEYIKETLTLIRTQSTIRFAALPFFLTALAVLANASHSKNGGFTDMKDTVALIGAGLSLIAIVIEIVISRNLIVWWQAIRDATETKQTDAKQKAPDWGMVYAHRNDGALKSARTALIVPYLAALYYWVFQLWNLWGFRVCGIIVPNSMSFSNQTRWIVLEGGIASFLVVFLIFCFAWYIWEKAEPEPSSSVKKTPKKLVPFWAKVGIVPLILVAGVCLYRTITAERECSCFYSTETAEIKCYVPTKGNAGIDPLVLEIGLGVHQTDKFG